MKRFIKKNFPILFGVFVVLFWVLVIWGFASLGNSEKSAENNTAETQEITYEEETKTESISFETSNEDDATLEKGQTKIKQEGKEGTKEIKYKISIQDGIEINREVISENIITEPIAKIVLIGTETVQAAVPPPTTQKTTPPPTTSPPTSTGFTCGSKTTCGQMSSCAEARFYMTSCGLTRLDRDKDGVPCESICK